jgi:hypothetical protein
MNKDRNFLGVWIPKNVYLNTDLSWSDKILLVEIESLDNEKGCFASNDYFADFLGVTKTTISTSISKLKRLGFLEQVSFDGRTRVIKVISSEFKKKKRQSLKKPKGRTKENLIHNNTINNSTNNTISIREQKFKNDVSLVGADTNTQKEFISYWTEKNSSGSKMKFEMEKTFDIQRRLVRWQNNSKKWNTQKGSSIKSSAESYMSARSKLLGI